MTIVWTSGPNENRPEPDRTILALVVAWTIAAVGFYLLCWR